MKQLLVSVFIITTLFSGHLSGQGLDDAFRISASGVLAQKFRLRLIAENIANQLERRIAYRRAVKRSIQAAMRMNIAGCKVMVGGRLNGAEIARTEWVREGQVRLHTLRVDIDYGIAEANTTYGIIGVKVWVYRGEDYGKSRGRRSYS